MQRPTLLTRLMSARKKRPVDGDEEARVHYRALYKAVGDERFNDCLALLRKGRYKGRHYEDIGNVLLQACLANAPLNVVSAIQDFYPQLVERMIVHGCVCTPLHVACCYSSQDVVEFVLAAAPHTAAVQDRLEQLPLHCAVSYIRSHSVVERLLVVHPTAVYSVTVHSETPLDRFLQAWRHIISSSCPSEFPGKDLLGVDDETDGLSKFKRTLALLLAAHIHGRALDTSEDLLLPHEAIRYGTTLRIPHLVNQVLVKTAPRTDMIRQDKEGNFPLHLVCA